VRALIAREAQHWKAAAQTTPASAFRVRDAAGVLLALDAIVAAGALVTLEGRANRAAGGDAEAVREGAPAALADFACAAAAALGLGLAGVDLFDVSPARDLSALVIIEVNANPAVETLAAHDRIDLVRAIWTANFAAALK